MTREKESLQSVVCASLMLHALLERFQAGELKTGIGKEKFLYSEKEAVMGAIQ